MEDVAEIIVIGAGAAGLMCAYELAKQGKKVCILEARDRIGGRIWEVEKGFGFPVQLGAEFIHGEASTTKALAKDAGLTVESFIVERLRVSNGSLVIDNGMESFQDVLNEKLQSLSEDMPVAVFLKNYFAGDQYKELRDFVTRMVERYDAADVNIVSTFTLRQEWLGSGKEWKQGRIKEGYGALLRFLETQCQNLGVRIYLQQVVTDVLLTKNTVKVTCGNELTYEGLKTVLTLPLPLLRNISFKPSLHDKMAATSKIGFGGVMKIHLLFTDRWWSEKLQSKESGKLAFILSNEAVPTWWAPELEQQLLVGWIAGPPAEKFNSLPSEEIIDVALTSLANIFGAAKDVLRKKLVTTRVTNWFTDPFALGAYSYPTPETEKASKELIKPVDNRIFFAGEALYRGQETATVEGALASGKEAAKSLLEL